MGAAGTHGPEGQAVDTAPAASLVSRAERIRGPVCFPPRCRTHPLVLGLWRWKRGCPPPRCSPRPAQAAELPSKGSEGPSALSTFGPLLRGACRAVAGGLPPEAALWGWVWGLGLPVPCARLHPRVHGTPVPLAADLGHGWPGALPHHHPELLPQRQRGHPGIRHHQEELLPVGASLDRGREEVRGLQHRAAAHR